MPRNAIVLPERLHLPGASVRVELEHASRLVGRPQHHRTEVRGALMNRPKRELSVYVTGVLARGLKLIPNVIQNRV